MGDIIDIKNDSNVLMTINEDGTLTYYDEQGNEISAKEFAEQSIKKTAKEDERSADSRH